MEEKKICSGKTFLRYIPRYENNCPIKLMILTDLLKEIDYLYPSNPTDRQMNNTYYYLKYTMPCVRSSVNIFPTSVAASLCIAAECVSCNRVFNRRKNPFCCFQIEVFFLLLSLSWRGSSTKVKHNIVLPLCKKTKQNRKKTK